MLVNVEWRQVFIHPLNHGEGVIQSQRLKQSKTGLNLKFSFSYIRSLDNSKKSIIIFTNPSARAGYDTRSIFKRSLTGLNSEYSFF